ncbi:LPS assembly lipoprotein LptE [Spongiibacter sp.]|uniref:LPS-assembly lipoprotein LptE n=1 Tax=Spongiibacter sp. TaxID=2024860 RepID=UPI00356158D9
MRTKLALLIAASLLLAACGFALRGSTSIADEWQPIYVGGDRGSQELQQALRRQLQISQVATTRKRSDAKLIAEVQMLRHDKRSITLNREARDAEYALYERARLSLLDSQGRRLRGPTVLEQRRLVVNDADNPVGEETESSIVRAEMREQLSIRLAQQLEYWSRQLTPDPAHAPAP